MIGLARLLRGWATVVLLAVGVLAPLPALAGQLVARVILSTQTMEVYRDGEQLHIWPVSTARRGHVTPTGTWTAQWLSANHRSSRYNNAPMPWSIFYHGHYAIHGTDQISRLGQPASAGCVRLHPDNARILFRMAQEVGLANMRVIVEP